MNVPKPVTGNGSSSVPRDKDFFASQDGLLRLLVAIRGSSLPSEHKMTARDAVLEYSQQTDVENRAKIKEDIISILSPYQNEFTGLIDTPPAKPVSSNKVSTIGQNDTVKSDSGFGSARPTPIFKSPTTTASDNKKPADSVNPESMQESLNNSELTKKSETPSPVQPPVQPAPEPTPTPTPATPPPVEASKVVEAEPVKSQSSTIEGHQERIKAIKRSVNERVGNPINLIDTNNEIGREYMNALLDAMKKVSGDGAGADTAMNRLEAAYKLVEELLRSGVTVGKQSKKEEPSNEPQKEIPSVEPPSTNNPAVEPQTVAVKPPTASEPEPPTRPDETELSDSVKKDTSVEESSQLSSRVPLRKIKLPSDDQPAETATKSVPVPKAESVIADRKEIASNKIKQSSVPADGARLRSLADTPNPFLKPAEQSPVNDKKTTTAKDAGGFWSHLTSANKDSGQGNQEESSNNGKTAPLKNTPTPPVDDKLFNPNVSAGLEQLLSEWKLFKSSGFFATGPGGKDHPLYKTLARLPMAAVIAGRFEGATPEVKQSIMDYMNGWRYEQGIIHELNENFDHYLRRVISHILARTPEKKEKK